MKISPHVVVPIDQEKVKLSYIIVVAGNF